MKSAWRKSRELGFDFVIPKQRAATIVTRKFEKLMKILLIALLAGTTILGQSKDEFRRKYGEPISETFMVRAGISIAVTYWPKGRIAELLISPRTPALIKSRNDTLSQADVTAILDEIVPMSARGKFLIGEFDNITCLPANDCQGTSENYEKVTIYYNAAAEGRVGYAVVQWKK
jgi:hypothetical protein